MPKIANPRNHREADTDGNARGFFFKLELASKYTRHSGAGDLDPEVGFSLVLRAGLGDLPKGWSNFSSSVYILIWGLQEH